MTMNVPFLKRVFKELVKTPACLMTLVGQMHSAVSNPIMLCAHVYQRQKETPMLGVNLMSALWMMIVLLH